MRGHRAALAHVGSFVMTRASAAWPWWAGPQWFVESAYASVRRCCPKAVTRWCVTWWGDRTRWVPEVIRARPHLWTAGVPRGPRLPGRRSLRFWSRSLVHAGRPRHRSLKCFPCLLVVGISGLLELHGGGAEHVRDDLLELAAHGLAALEMRELLQPIRERVQGHGESKS